jgi:hypothetical protein
VDVIEDPVEARRRIDRFLERAARRDVYGELLARGQVGRVLEDPEARKQLRSELRRQARADKLRIITREYDDVVIALSRISDRRTSTSASRSRWLRARRVSTRPRFKSSSPPTSSQPRRPDTGGASATTPRVSR